MKSSISGMNYTYSIVNEPDNHRFVVVVYLKPQNLLKANQTEIGRVYIDDFVMMEQQSKNQQGEYVAAHVDNLVKTYEAGIEKTKLDAMTKDIHLVEGDGTSIPEPMQSFIKTQAAAEVNAELGGYLEALGINVSAGIPPAMHAIVKKAAELKKAQMEGRPNQAFLIQELDAMKHSFKQTAVTEQNKFVKTKKPIYVAPTHTVPSYTSTSTYVPSEDYDDDDDDDYWYDDDEDKEPESPAPKPVKKGPSRPVISPAFVETTRRFMED